MRKTRPVEDQGSNYDSDQMTYERLFIKFM